MRLCLVAAEFGRSERTSAAAQGLVTQKALSLEMAQAIIQGTVERCRADGFSVERDGHGRERPPQSVCCAMRETARTRST